MKDRAEEIAHESSLPFYDACVAAMGDVLDFQCKTVGVPRRFTAISRDIWQLVLRMERSKNNRAYKLLEQPSFAPLLICFYCGVKWSGYGAKSAAWWSQFIDADEA